MNKQYQGLKNRAAGKAFEDRIQMAFDYCEKIGIAKIDKTPEPFRIIQRQEGGRFVGVFSHKAQPDYKGVIAGGRTVMFEAKYTSTDRIRQEAVTAEQANYLTKMASLGAWCFVICGFSSGSAFKIPWEIWKDMQDFFGHKYVMEKDLEPYTIKFSRNGILEIISERRN